MVWLSGDDHDYLLHRSSTKRKNERTAAVLTPAQLGAQALRVTRELVNDETSTRREKSLAQHMSYVQRTPSRSRESESQSERCGNTEVQQ